MKQILLLSIFCIAFLYCPAGFGQVLDNVPLNVCNTSQNCPQNPICTLTDDCFKFDYYGAIDLGNGKSAMKFKITNFGEFEFKTATFELPGNGNATNPASKPNSTFSNRFKHTITNPLTDSLIAFEARNVENYKYGGFEIYYYIVNTADLNAPAGRKTVVTALAGRNSQLQRTGKVQFNLDVCEGKCSTIANTSCYKEDCCFGYRLLSSQTDSGTGEIRPTFEITNTCGKEITGITFSTPGVAATNPTADKRVYTITAINNLLTFSDPSPAFNSNVAGNNTNQFSYSLPASAVSAQGGNMVTITVKTTSGNFSQTLDLLNNNSGCGGSTSTSKTELTDFAGAVAEEGIALNWKTKTESNHDRFEVEESSNGKDFSKIGSVKGAGNSTQPLAYNFVDKNITSLPVYYRLNLVDLKGANSYSPVIKINAQSSNAGNFGIKLLPNPCFNENCNIQILNIDTNLPLKLEMHDLTGRLVFSRELPPDQNNFELPKIDNGNGVYILTARNGRTLAHLKVILN